MLSYSKKAIAQDIAITLANEGMIFGQELEWYIKAEEFNHYIKFKGEEERNEFIDYILSHVEIIWGKITIVHDDQNNTQKIFINSNDAAEFLGVKQQTVSISRKNKTKIKKRYRASPYKPKIVELYEGINNIRTRWNI